MFKNPLLIGLQATQGYTWVATLLVMEHIQVWDFCDHRRKKLQQDTYKKSLYEKRSPGQYVDTFSALTLP